MAYMIRRIPRFLPVLLILTGAALLFERQAHAYADPGTGLLAIQAIGSVLVAAGWYLRRKIYGLMHWGTPKKPENQAYPPAKQDEASPIK